MRVDGEYGRGVLQIAAMGAATALLAGACQERAEQESQMLPAPEVQLVASPVEAGSMFPTFSAAAAGGEATRLAWIQEIDDQARLMTATCGADASCADATEVARAGIDRETGPRWFVNWADLPGVVELENGRLTAHWLEYLGEGTYAYGVRLSDSDDGGSTWSEARWLHDDTSPQEHGFVSLTPMPGHGAVAIWLDGREMEPSDHGDSSGHGHGSGAMTLRSRVIGRDGALGNETQIDDMTCECCSTAAVRTSSGAYLIAFRDRSSREIRDIAISRYDGSAWTQPALVSRDGWKIAGCPVNGPRLARRGSRVALAWYTEGDDASPAVKIVFSSDDGKTFGRPLRVDEGDPLGRVDIAFVADDEVLVSWIDRSNGGEIVARRVDFDRLRSDIVTVSGVSTSRASGMPRMGSLDDRALLAWTAKDAEADLPRLQMAIVR